MPRRDHFRSRVKDDHSWYGLFGGWYAVTLRLRSLVQKKRRKRR